MKNYVATILMLFFSLNLGAQTEGLISNIKQLTFDGPRAGEGYFSADGKKLIFQSERAGKNPFYQIYLMDLQTGQSELLSPGYGNTTCAWVHPSNKKVLFASTHLDALWKKKEEDELKERQNPQKKKYSWAFDDQYDIFEKNLPTGKLKNLTNTLGYDAEGSYSPDGQWIAFASNRLGYTEKLSAEENKIFTQDPSYMMDIYIMRADGSGVKRLTEARGYDGGPFFSADGKKITWRRFTPNGQSAEIYTMNVDGSDQKPLTKLNAMSWAPFFHPSGDYLIFTTNINGYTNFELYIVDKEGKKDPVRVTDLPDFDGLPTFSPDGNKLSWTRRDSKGESQIYLADWNDQEARRLLGLTPAKPFGLAKEISIPDIKKWVYYLASDELKGRATGSPEEKLYTTEIEKFFKDLGLQLIPSEFEFTSGIKLGENNQLNIEGKKPIPLKLSENFIPLSFSKNGKFKVSGLVFAGYGLKVPASDSQNAYDSYKDLDVSGKWVMVLRDIPENVPNKRRIYFNTYSRIYYKALAAKNLGAAGMFIVNGSQYKSQKLQSLRYDSSAQDVGIPVLQISNDVADQILANAGKDLFSLQKELDNEKLVTASVDRINISTEVHLVTEKSKGKNVVAKLNVANAKHTITIGAHGDALGLGQFGNSLARANEKDMIHYGADDNASGVSAIMELAHLFTELKNKKQLKANYIFAVWSGEEIGILGSNAFLNQNPKLKMDAYINLDMIGRFKEKLNIQGAGSGVGWKPQIEKLSLQYDLPISVQEDPYLPSDAMAFYLKNIPTIMFFTGAHSEYHSPRDRAELIDFPGIQKITNMVKDLSLNLSESGRFPIRYVKVESSKVQMRGGFRIYLGTIPDYAQDGVKGVKISGTSKDSPAEKAGLKTGDIILELAGQKIENMYDYVYCLQAIKANQATTIKVNRQGSIKELNITPVAKE